MGLTPNDSRKAYVQVADELRSEIQAGIYNPGDQLPSTNDLVSKYGVANMTIQGAIRLLRDENLVYSVQGRGTFVRSDVDLDELGSTDSGGPSPEFVELRSQLETLAGAVERIEQRMDDIEQETPKRRSTKAKR